jgi:hypothetical protein
MAYLARSASSPTREGCAQAGEEKNGGSTEKDLSLYGGPLGAQAWG